MSEVKLTLKLALPSPVEARSAMRTFSSVFLGSAIVTKVVEEAS